MFVFVAVYYSEYVEREHTTIKTLNWYHKLSSMFSSHHTFSMCDIQQQPIPGGLLIKNPCSHFVWCFLDFIP